MKPHGQSIISVTSVSTTGVSYLKPLVVHRTDQELDDFRKEISTDVHQIPVADLVQRLGTNIETGLSRMTADHLLKMNGPNCLVASEMKSRWLIFFGFLFGGFAALLWMGAVLSLLGFTLAYLSDPENPECFDHLYLGSVLVVVVTFSGVFGFYQESSSEAIMESFKKMVPSYAIVIRDGTEYTIPSEEVVVGDLVEIHAGGTVPADIRVIDSSSLKVDNSPLTGESDPQSKYPKCTSDNPLETANLAFYSTNIVEGKGRGIVVSCGDDTLIGHIAALTTTLKKEETPIHKEIRRFIKIITVLAITIGLTFFILCLQAGYNFFISFSFFIALIIANVPEGLPVTLTACMTLTAKRMASKNCLVKKLEAIETLGACNVICSDKTGTLTENRMTVSHMIFDGQEWDVLNNYSDVDRDSQAFNALVDIAMLCSRATFIDKEDKNIPINRRRVAGDASESAILKFLEALIGDVAMKRELKPKICEVPFNSNNKFQLSIHRLPDDKYLLVIKGAPERIIARCKTYLTNDNLVELDEDISNELMEAILHVGRRGERVLAFADLLLPDTYGPDYVFNAEKQNFPLEGYRFIGLLSMMDPPRLAVPHAVRLCKEAGIRVIMVTGDHPVTAEAIAKKVGIISNDSIVHTDVLKRQEGSLLSHSRFPRQGIAGVVTGNDLREMTDVELEMTLMRYKEIIFARTSPQQKLKIVEALQGQNLIVAVTGDGVNDSPALKKADIGVAMGITGSDVAKNAADMILLDDNFSSIVTGIEEGRLIFDNLKKSIAYVLTSNVPEIVPFIVLVGFNLPQSLTVMAIVLIDIGTDLWPAISLAYEKPEADIMRRNPRDPKKDRLINTRLIYLAYGQIGFIQSVGAFIVYFFIMAQHGFYYDRLIGLRVFWDSETINDLKDSYGQEWTYPERMYLQRKCVAGFFVSIVMTQTTDLLICKTRRLSLFEQGMSNMPLNYSIVFAMFVMILSVYCPGVKTFFQFEPVDWWPYILTTPFVLIIFGYDECRKWLIRKYPKGFAYRETYY
ncbi:hypothetical protein HHI36_014039 [Cryptolaemus montrouzieri]|uniref:Sodium/potassium-transporting ATPase subunit alpha n=1 Tax=Cryptolaemus montrouzieri TaxID=559131 RepID=A0ABD2N2N3_9CUCU